MEWYVIAIIVVSVLLGAYLIVCAIAAPKFLDMVCRAKGRTWEISRQLMEEQDKWDFNRFDNEWDKQPFELTTFDGLKLYCINIPNPNTKLIEGKNKVAIVCHGHVSNLMQSVKYADIFYDKGYNVIIYDNRYFGHSEGDYCTLGQNETKDLAMIIDKAKELYGNDCFIALHGESMAGATVLNVLSLREQDVALVIADCPFMDTWKLFRENAHEKAHFPSFPLVDMAAFLAKHKYEYDFSAVRPIKVVGNVNTPICYIHGTADRLIYPHHSIDLYNRTKNKDSQLHLFEGAVHARSHMQDKQKYRTVVGQFVDSIEQKYVDQATTATEVK